MSVGNSFEGEVENRGDEDCAGVEPVAGNSYDIRLQGIWPDRFYDTFLRLCNSFGKQVVLHDDVDNAAGMWSIRW